MLAIVCCSVVIVLEIAEGGGSEKRRVWSCRRGVIRFISEGHNY